MQITRLILPSALKWEMLALEKLADAFGMATQDKRRPYIVDLPGYVTDEELARVLPVKLDCAVAHLEPETT